MDLFLGIVLIVTFIIMVMLMVKGVNATLVLTIGAIVWAFLGGRTVKEILDITFGEIISKNALTFMVICGGAWYSQMVVQTGIASSLIRKAVELGGDRPKIVVSLLMVVVSFLFITMFGVGPAIAIGVIILPIMMSMGVEPRIAAVAMTLPIAVSTGINISQYYAVAPLIDAGATFGYPYFPYAAVAYGFALVIAIIGVNILLRRSKPAKAWGVNAAEGSEQKKVPWFAYLTLFVPIVLIVICKVSVFVSFVIAIAYTAVTTMDWKNKDWKHFNLIIKTSKDGFADAAPVVLFIASTWLFADSARLVNPLIINMVGGVLPTTRLGVCILFAIIAPLVMYRGPACYAGAGIALYNGLIGMGLLPPTFIFTVGYTMEVVHYQLDPTVSVVAWTTGYTGIKASDYVKTALLIVWVIAIVYMALTFIMVNPPMA
jgi:H+/gluconate symporter-like permease